MWCLLDASPHSPLRQRIGVIPDPALTAVPVFAFWPMRSTIEKALEGHRTMTEKV
jgi:hypothetical protein